MNDDVSLHAGMIGDPDARMPTVEQQIIDMERLRAYGPAEFAGVIVRGVRQALAAERARCAAAVCYDCRRGVPRRGSQHSEANEAGHYIAHCWAAAIWALP